MNVLALIPARGGSKGLPGKNIRLLAGKPLLAYAIESALRCPHITRVVVSTDSPAIADVAQHYGADVPFLRPPQLAGDKASVGQALTDAVNRLAHDENYVPDITLEFFPTSPFRSDGLVRFLVERLLEGYHSVSTARCVASARHGLFSPDAQGRLRPVTECGPLPDVPSQRRYGILSGTNPHGMLGPYLYTVTDPVMLVDIDTPEDFQLAETILQRGLFDFGAAADVQPPVPVPAPAALPLELALPVLTMGDGPTGDRLTDRDLLRGTLGQGLINCCRDLAAKLRAYGEDVPPETILSNLERLCQLDPGLPALGQLLDDAMDAAASGDIPPGTIGLLAELFRHPETGWYRDIDNVLAVAGMAACRAKKFGHGLPLLEAVRWEHIRHYRYFLDRFFPVRALGVVGEREAARMARELHDACIDTTVGDTGLQATFGISCGISGQGDVAARLLPPLLPEAMATPERFFLMVSALLFSGQTQTARRFLTPHRLKQLKTMGYDPAQRANVASLLLRLGLPGPARDWMTDVALDQRCPTEANLRFTVHGLVRVGRTELADRLMDDFAAQENIPCNLADLTALAHARISAGQPEAARRVLAAVDIGRLDTPLLVATFMDLFERSGATDQLLALGGRTIPDDARPGPNDWQQHLSLALYRHTLPELLARTKAALTNAPDQQSLLYGLHHIALWAGDTATVLETTARMGTTPGIFPGLMHEALVDSLLLQNQVEAALPLLELKRDQSVILAMHLGACIDIWEGFFNYARMLWYRNRPEEALAVARQGIRLEKTPHNPCRALEMLLRMALGQVAPRVRDIRALVRLGDRQTAARNLIGPWLHLRAARLAKELGQDATAGRIVRTKLAAWAILEPGACQAMTRLPLNRPDVSFAALHDTAQAAFFPHRRGTFVNALLTADLGRN